MDKKKTKKKNILKRRQDRKKKREKEVRAKKLRKTESSPSFSKAKKYLSNLPYLIFEPEIDQVKIESAELERLDALDGLSEELTQLNIKEFLPRLKTPLVDLQIRLPENQNPQVNFCAKTIEQMLEQEKHHQFLMNFFLAKYLKDKRDFFNCEEKLTRENLLEILETTFASIDDSVKTMTGDEEQPAGDNDAKENATWSSEFDESEFGVFLQTLESSLGKTPLGGTNIDNLSADASIFFEEYLFEEKKINGFADIRPGLFANFLSGWYVRNISPSKEDMMQAFVHFDLILNELEKQNRLEAEVLAKIRESLKDKDTFLKAIE